MAEPPLEIHVPISPTDLFFNRIHYLAASIREYGGALADARIVVSIGADAEPEPIAGRLAWARRYPIEWRWIDRDLFRKHSYFATRLVRFTHEFAAPVVMMLDPDVLAVGPLDDLIEAVARSGAFHGVVAHTSPVRDEFTWEKLFASAGLATPEFVCEHSGWGLMEKGPRSRRCPAYFNLGVMTAPADSMRRIGTTILNELEAAYRHSRFFIAQPAVTLAIYRHAVAWRAMAMKFNFPNDQRFAERYCDDFADMRLVHYLRKDDFDKEVDFASPKAIGALFDRDAMQPVNRTFLARLGPIHARVLADLGR